MNKGSEKVIERRLVEAVKQRGGLCIKLLCDQFLGLPDRMCLLPEGVIIFVEVKTTGCKPRKIQSFVHSQLRALGFAVEIIDRIEDINTIINRYVNRESTT